MIKRFYIIPFFITCIWCLSCEKDDICSETTATTPHLIIRFYDINNPSQPKSVRQLSVIGNGDNLEPVISNRSTDSIALPLKFNEENIYTVTEFELKKNSDYDTDPNSGTNSDSDFIKITTLPIFKYVSRACGFKSIYTESKISIIEDSSNWIFNYEIVNDHIEYENKAHIKIYH